MGRKRKYCSTRCAYMAGHKAYHDLNPPARIERKTVGAISEYRVVVDLLSKGFNVFHACSPACPCDIIVSINNKILRIEVTTGKRTNNGRIHYPSHNSDNYDIIAAVLPDTIFYFPDVNHYSFT